MPESFAEVALMFKNMREESSWSAARLAEMAGLPVDIVLSYESDPTTLTSRIAMRVLDAAPVMMLPENKAATPAPPLPCDPPRLLLGEMDARELEWKAALAIDKARFRDALADLDRALAVRPWPERMGRLLLGKAEVLGELRRERHALDVLREAEAYLDIDEEPEIWLRLRIDQMYVLCHLEEYAAAAAYRQEARLLAERIGRDRERRQLLCLEGRIAAGLGRSEEALAALGAAREELLAAGKLFEACCASLDAAAVLAAQGRLAEVAEMARQLESCAQEKKLSEASRATLRLFCRLAPAGNFTPEMGRRFAADFRTSDTRLTRPFELPGEQSNGGTSPALQQARAEIGKRPSGSL